MSANIDLIPSKEQNEDTEKAPIIEALKIEAEKLFAAAEPALEDYEYLRITDTTPIDAPEPIVCIEDAIISTPGDLTAISGPEKVGKSAICSIVEAGAISMTGIVDGLEGLNVMPNTSGRAVIKLDTEQARHKQQANLKATLRRASILSCPDFFLSYNIRQLEISEYQDLTTSIFKAASKQFKGIHIAIIDGVADYIKSVNDETEANAIVKFFEFLAIEFNCPIILIIHTNPGSEKERGHLGSQLLRKAGSVLQVKKDQDVSFIEPKRLRYAGSADVPLLQFMYNRELGYHTGCGNKSTITVTKEEKNMVAIENYVEAIFKEHSAIGYQHLVEEIMKVSKKSERTSKDRLKEMKAHQLIIQNTDGHYVKANK